MKPILLALLLLLSACTPAPASEPAPSEPVTSWWMQTEGHDGQPVRKTCNASGCF